MAFSDGPFRVVIEATEPPFPLSEPVEAKLVLPSGIRQGVETYPPIDASIYPEVLEFLRE